MLNPHLNAQPGVSVSAPSVAKFQTQQVPRSAFSKRPHTHRGEEMTTLRVPEIWLVSESPRKLHGPTPCLLKGSRSCSRVGTRTRIYAPKPGALIVAPKVCSESGILQF